MKIGGPGPNQEAYILVVEKMYRLITSIMREPRERAKVVISSKYDSCS